MTMAEQDLSELPPNALAIVGVAVHAPGARDARALFAQFLAGQVASEALSDEQLRGAGVPERLLRHPRYVRHTFRLPGLAEFDPEFFGLTPRDAALIDPQTRHLYECTWEALEDAAIDPTRPPGPIGLFVGAPGSDYLLQNLLPNQALIEEHGLDKLLQLGNDRDFIASRIAYALDLRGPCMGIAVACSSGLLAVHSACQSLIGRECRVALAGAASIHLPHGVGYLFEEGGLSAPDGVCRSFDASAQGTVPSSGVGMVALMRLEDAVREGRTLYASILATAFNNDGRRKVGYAAPSVEGPLSAIEEVLAVAGVEARSIGYVEAHGTATPFGDSIEVSALTKAFRAQTEDVGFCVLGANKPNIGHTDAASGVISLIKAALTLKTRTIAPLANFREPHPLLELPTSPFRVATDPMPWQQEDGPRRALVNCLAVGGTNVVVALEEAPDLPPRPSASDGPELLLLSARSPEALAALQLRLADHLVAHPALSLRDIAHTLRAGRPIFAERKALVVATREDAIAQLRGEDARAVSAAPDVVRLIELARRFREEREPEFTAELGGEGALFVPLPGYPFERRAFWVEPEPGGRAFAHEASALAPDGGVPHARVEYVECGRSTEQPSAGQRWLVFVDETGLGERVIARLREHGCEVIAARLGNGPALARKSPHEFRIDCDRGFEGPAALIGELGREGRLPDVILHLWTITTDERFRSATNRFHHDLERGYGSILAICQGLAAVETSQPVRFVGVTNGALHTGSGRVAFPAKAMLLGPLLSVPLEQPNVTSCVFDVEIPVGLKRALLVPQLLERANDELSALLLPEAVSRASGVYALHGTQLVTRTLVSMAPPASGSEVGLRSEGCYVVLGGFGNLGYAIARELSARAPLKLVLVGRTPLPDRAYWDEWLTDHPESDPVSVRMRMVHTLEESGAEVLALSADICHLESMSSALTLARRRFGQLHGVIHAAGSLSEALCGTQTLDEARDAVAPEVLGARVLEELLRRDRLDFFIMLGNSQRFSPRPGTYARNAASEFADAFADRAGMLRPRVFDLGLVSDGGMYLRWVQSLEAEGRGHDPHVRAVNEELDRGLPSQTVARAVVDALASGARRLVIGPAPRPRSPMPVVALARSELRRAYVAPETDTERKLAQLWAEALRIDRVGVTDDFFELGGHSLIAVRLGARIKTTWGVAVPLALIIEAPTVRQLAKLIDERGQQRKGSQSGVQVLREWTTIVPLQPHGSRPPLFCVGGKGGNVMNLRHLAALLGREQPVFGLQARGVDENQKPHETVEAMVDEYLADLQRVCPKGPYLLSGFSGGGALILEMARRLKQQGHVVGPLLFLDAWNPAAPERTFREKVRAHTGLFRELGPRYAGMLVTRAASERAQSLLQSHAPSIAHRIWEAPPTLGAVADAWESAAARYQPQPYEGDAVLFRVRADRSRGELELTDDEQNGWGDLVRGGIEVIDVPGTHTSLVEEPHVRTLAQSVRTVLDRTLRKLQREQGTRDSVPSPPT